MQKLLLQFPVWLLGFSLFFGTTFAHASHSESNFPPLCTAPGITGQPGNAIMCASGTSSFTVTATGTTLDYQWEQSTNGGSTWTNVSNGSGFSGADTRVLTITNMPFSLDASEYRCIVSNVCGTITSDEVVLTVRSNPKPIISGNGPMNFCLGENVVLTSSSATGNLWSNGETGQSVTISQQETITVTTTYANGCYATSSPTTVNVHPLPVISSGTIVNPTCLLSNGSVQINGTETGLLSWTGPVPGNSTINSFPFVMPNLSAGTYSVSFTNSNQCTSATVPVTLTDPGFPATPVITADGPLALCTGQDVVLTSSASSGNEWSTGETTQSITVHTASSITVTVTNGGGCTATSSTTTITVNNVIPTTPFITADGALTFCEGAEVELTSSAATGNLWSTGETTQSITVSESGTYTVEVTDAACSAESVPTEVVVEELPEITAGTVVDPACTLSTGSVQVLGSGSGTLSWTGTTTGTLNVTALPQIVSGLGAGTYEITFTSTLGCVSNELTATLTSQPAPAAATISANGPLTFCEGGEVILTSSAATGNLWSNGLTTQSITVTASGTYSVTLGLTGCDAESEEKVVVVKDLPEVQLSALPTVCNYNPSFVLNQGTPSGGVYSGNGVTSGSFDPSVGNGNYTITYTVSEDGCSSSATGTIAVSGCAGLEEEAETALLIYPNPSTGNIYLEGIDVSGFESVELRDATGRLMHSWKTENANMTLDLTGFATGNYLIHISGNKGSLVRKIQIQ